eukprot:XP_014787928.1 PREDICTED: uncharacterized protein LOC106881919 isoform X2 [Octopus bimaculoides]
MSSSIPIADPDDYEICPYDPVHRVQSRRMVYHLEKCRKNFPMKKTRICPFNNKHRIPEPEFRYHLVLCPDKAILDQDLKHAWLQQNKDDEELPSGNLEVPDTNFQLNMEEDWEADSEQKFFKLGAGRIASSHSVVDTNQTELRLPAHKFNNSQDNLPVYQFSSNSLLMASEGIGRGRGKGSKPVVPVGRGRGTSGCKENVTKLGKPGASQTATKPGNASAVESAKLSVSVDKTWLQDVNQNCKKKKTKTKNACAKTVIKEEPPTPVTAEDEAKTIRRLRKKLRQISLLEEQKSAGLSLDKDQPYFLSYTSYRQNSNERDVM